MTRKTLAIVVILVCGACLPALAQEAYVGASYMNSSGEFFVSGDTFNPDASGWKVFAGYNSGRFFGVEATYYDLGDLEDVQGASTFSADISVYDLALRGILPIGERFELFGKIGYSSVSVDATLVRPLTTTTAEASDWELIYGVGAALKLGQSFGIRAEWEAWDIADSLDAFSLGAYFRFGGR